MHQVAYVGGSARIFCNSKTKPKWKKDGKLLTLATVYYIDLINVTFLSGGIYTCFGSKNKGGTDSFSVSSDLVIAGTVAEV